MTIYTDAYRQGAQYFYATHETKNSTLAELDNPYLTTTNSYFDWFIGYSEARAYMREIDDAGKNS